MSRLLSRKACLRRFPPAEGRYTANQGCVVKVSVRFRTLDMEPRRCPRVGILRGKAPESSSARRRFRKRRSPVSYGNAHRRPPLYLIVQLRALPSPFPRLTETGGTTPKSR